MSTVFPPFEPNGQDDGGRGPKLRQIPVRLLVPNFITVLAICAGMTGIRLAIENRFELAVTMVLIAAFLDGIDGRVARLLKAQSRFGVQMDSLADIINFGIAPALVLYLYMLDQAGSFGWIASLVYAIAAALRLARFNVSAESPAKARWQALFFVGVPAPAGALIVFLPVYLGFLGLTPGQPSALFWSLYTVFIGFLLISRLPVFSGKGIGDRVRRDLVMPVTLVVVIYVSLLMSFTWETLTVTAIGFLLSLPVGSWHWSRTYGPNAVRKRDAVEISAESDGDEPQP